MSFTEKGKALLVVHAHQSMLTDRGQGEVPLQNAATELERVIDQTRKSSLMPIIHLVMVDGPHGPLNDQDRKTLFEKLKDTSMDFIPGCEPQAHEIVFTASDKSGFNTMHGYLRDNKSIKRIILAGFHTSCCVYDNAKDLIGAGLKVGVLTEATVSVDIGRTEEGLQMLKDLGVEEISSNQFNWLLSAYNGYLYSPINSHELPAYVEKEIELGIRKVHVPYDMV